MDAIKTIKTEEQTDESTRNKTEKSEGMTESRENAVNEIFGTAEEKEEKILPAVRNIYGGRLCEPIDYSVSTQFKTVKAPYIPTSQPEIIEKRETYAGKVGTANAAESDFGNTSGAFGGTSDISGGASDPFGGAAKNLSQSIARETARDNPFGNDKDADKASVIFGQSEAEMRREFKAFKAAKLFKKFDCDLTDVFSPEEFDQKLIEAKNYGFGAVVVTPQKIKIAKTKLKGTGVEVVAAVCFPFGEECFGVKKYAVKKAVEKGADRVYVPVGVSAVKFGATDLIRREFKKIIKAAKKKKVSAVLENGVTNSSETEKTVRALNGAGVMSFVSSSGRISDGDGVSSVKNIRYFLRSGSEISGFTSSRKSEDAVGLMSVADRLFVKNAAELASDIRANLRY